MISLSCCTILSFSLTASVVSRVTPSLPPGQPVHSWSWGGFYLSASSVLLRCSSSCRAPRLSLSVHSAHLLSACTSTLSRTTFQQPVPVLLSSLPSSFLSSRFLFLLLLFRSSVLRSVFPAWRSGISCVVHASSSSKRSLRYTARA